MEKSKKNSIIIISMHLLHSYTILSHIGMIWLASKTNFFPENSSLMQIVGIGAQIIAGLYGITITGYIFFLTRMDALLVSNTTLTDIVESVKNRFKHLIWSISFQVLCTLILSIILMYYRVSSGIISEYVYRVLCNEFVLFMVNSILFIIYYSISVVNPNCLEKEARELKNKIEGKKKTCGSVIEFLDYYKKIERCCYEKLPADVMEYVKENKENQFETAMYFIQEQKMLEDSVIKDIYYLRKYYCCVRNCKLLTVTQEMCNMVKQIYYKVCDSKLT